MQEQWRAVPGYEGRYEVSDQGRVRSLPGRQAGRVLKPGRQSQGYRSVVLYDGSSPKKPKSHLVHSLVISVFGPLRPSPQHEVNHKDMDKDNNQISNLEWVTGSENIKHAVANGTHCGEQNGRSKLTDAQVAEIRKALNEAPHDRKLAGRLAHQYGVSRWYIGQLRLGRYRKKAS